MSLLVRQRGGDSPSKRNYYKESSLYTKSDIDMSYTYNPAQSTYIAQRYMDASPIWRFSNTDYCVEDEDCFPEEEENAIDLLVKRALISSAVNEENEDSFGLNSADDGLVQDMDYANRPKYVLPTFEKKEWKKKMRGSRRDWKKEKMPAPELIGPWGLHLPLHTIRGQYPNGEESVTMPLNLYRDTVMAEVDSLARRIYDYYNDELRAFEELRVDAVKDSFLYHEKCNFLKKRLEERNAEVRLLKAEVATLRHQIEGEQMLKKRRKADKKRRRAQKNAASQEKQSESETGGEGDPKDGNVEPNA